MNASENLAQRMADVIKAAQDLADYVRDRSFKHVTEVKLIEAVDAYRKVPEPGAFR